MIGLGDRCERPGVNVEHQFDGDPSTISRHYNFPTRCSSICSPVPQPSDWRNSYGGGSARGLEIPGVILQARGLIGSRNSSSAPESKGGIGRRSVSGEGLLILRLGKESTGVVNVPQVRETQVRSSGKGVI